MKSLGLASPERLKKHLGITPGSVSLLALVNDPDHRVRLIVDIAVWEADALRCHPLVNTSTLVVSQAGVRRFLEATGHEALVMEVPTRA
jgi:Ala-tRNA(Pro) deacylase